MVVIVVILVMGLIILAGQDGVDMTMSVVRLFLVLRVVMMLLARMCVDIGLMLIDIMCTLSRRVFPMNVGRFAAGRTTSGELALFLVCYVLWVVRMVTTYDLALLSAMIL